MTASITATATATSTTQAAAPSAGLARHLAALGLASALTLTLLSAMTGLADGYRSEQQLAQAQAASQPVAMAQVRKAPRG